MTQVHRLALAGLVVDGDGRGRGRPRNAGLGDCHFRNDRHAGLGVPVISRQTGQHSRSATPGASPWYPAPS